VTTNWSLSGVCRGLSVTKSYKVLATITWNDTKQIYVYTTHGRLKKRHPLDKSIDKPCHCVQLSTGNFVVSNIGQTLRLCIVDKTGHILQSYSSYYWSTGPVVGKLTYPHRLAVDIHDNVLVADQRNHRLQLFSPSLTYLGNIEMPGHQLNHPHALHFDELNHRLYIGEWNSGRMFVLYDIKDVN